MTTVIEVDDSAEEAAATRSRKRLAQQRADHEAAATAQTRTWQSAHERLVRMAEQTGQRHERMMSTIRTSAVATEAALVAVAAGSERVLLRTSAMLQAMRTVGGEIKDMFTGLAKGTLVVGAHAVAMDKLVNIYRVGRLALSPTLFTAGTLGIGIALEESVRIARQQAGRNRVDSMAAVQTGSSFLAASTSANASRILGIDSGSYRQVFDGKTPSQVGELVQQYSKLKDPVDQASFAVRNFGSNAAAAIPLLTSRLREANEAAFEFSSAMGSQHRQALEILDEGLRKPADALRSLRDNWRAFKLDVKEGIAIKVAMVVEAYQRAEEWQKGGRQTAASKALFNAGQGRLRGVFTPDVMKQFKDQDKAGVPSNLTYLQIAQSATDAAGELPEKLRPTGAVGLGEVSEGLRAQSQAAVSRYDNSVEGLSRRFGDAQSNLAIWRENLRNATGDKEVFAPQARRNVVKYEAEAAAVKPLLERARKEEADRQAAAGKAEREYNARREFNRRLDQYDNAQRRAAEAETDRVGTHLGNEVDRSVEDQRAQTSANAAVFLDRYYSRTPAPPRGFESIAQYSTRVSHQERMAEINAPDTAPGQYQLAGQLYNSRLAAIKAIEERELKILDINRDAAEVANVKDRAELEAAQVRYDYEERITAIQRRQFEDTKQSLAGLFDASLHGGRSLGRAALSFAKSTFLDPVRDAVAAVGARAINPVLYGANGDGGIVGRITGLFNGGNARGGIGDVRLVNGAVPVVIAGVGSGGGAAGSAVQSSGWLGAGLGLGGLLGPGGTPGFAGRVTAETLGGGGSTAGLIQLSSGLWQRGPAAADLYSLPTRAGSYDPYMLAGLSGGPGGTPGFAAPVGSLGKSGFTAAGLQSLAAMGMLTGGIGLFSGGLQRGSAARTISGGALAGAGVGLMGGPVGAIAGAGVGLAADGIRRGGVAGLGETTAGGALVGLNVGGPIGAAIGSAVGFTIGVVRLFIKGKQQKIREMIQTIYGVRIESQSIIKQIADMADQGFGGDINVAVRSPQVRELVRLYAQTTGQRTGLDADVVHGASLTQSGGGLYQSATYANGMPYTYDSSLPTLGPSVGTLPTSGPGAGGTTVVQLDPAQTVDLWRTGTTAAIQGDARGVAAASARGARGSAARTRFASALAPGYIAG